MTTIREAAQQALDVLIRASSYYDTYAEVDALRAALEQQAQQDETRDSLERYTQEIRTVLSGAAKREWQGLTDYEINNFDLPESGTVTIREFVRIIEAKLKEKNT